MAFPYLMTCHSHPRPHTSKSPHLAISPNLLHPHIVATHCLTRWLTPFGVSHMNALSAFFPAHVITMSHTLLSKSVAPTTLTNYSSGLMCFSCFCDDYCIPESLHIPASEALLMMFIMCRGTDSVLAMTMHHWLLGLELWHKIKGTAWCGCSTLKRAVKAASLLAPAIKQKPCEPVTMQHLEQLCTCLNFDDPFDAAVFAITCLVFWSHAQLGELLFEATFDP